jgi:hypothetical protein
MRTALHERTRPGGHRRTLVKRSNAADLHSLVPAGYLGSLSETQRKFRGRGHMEH